jgi:hypothetical protein
MGKKNSTKLKKSSKKRSTKKSMRKNKSRKQKLFRGGKCPCGGGDASPSQLVYGGEQKKHTDAIMVGGYGPASFQPMPLHTFYDKTDPTTMPFPASDRNTPMNSTTPILMGGKKSRKNKNVKIMHGGDIFPQWLSRDPILGNTNNVVQYTNTTPGAYTGNNLLNGQGYSYASITDGPLLNINRTAIV